MVAWTVRARLRRTGVERSRGGGRAVLWEKKAAREMCCQAAGRPAGDDTVRRQAEARIRSHIRASVGQRACPGRPALRRRPAMSREPLAQLALGELADARLGQTVQEDDVVRQPPLRDPRRQPVEEVLTA